MLSSISIEDGNGYDCRSDGFCLLVGCMWIFSSGYESEGNADGNECMISCYSVPIGAFKGMSRLLNQ